ncbi:MAG: glycine cleavage system protein GcvH [Planctomycetes bacterium]|nr:glycine cleavage system protein GcvH [Planctomycetota bacterium]
MRPTDRKYLKSHEWCKIENGIATLGITDFAVSHLSDLVFLDLPNKGASVTAGESFGEIESVKAVSSLYSPVSGEVIDCNKNLPDNLEWLAQDPFNKSWMIKVKVTAQSKALIDAAAYETQCQAEG